jgi:hypothetical protein
MSIGKYVSLKEARKQNKLKRFIKEHPSKGNLQWFEDLLNNMTHNIRPKKHLKDGKTLKKE